MLAAPVRNRCKGKLVALMNPVMRPVSSTRTMTYSAVLSAAAVALALLIRFPLLPGAPFLLYEPSDVPLLLGAFLLGPAWTAGIALVTALLLGIFGTGGLIGTLSRFAGSAALGVTTALVYRRVGDRSWGGWLAVLCGLAAYCLVEVIVTIVLGPLFFGSMSVAMATILPVVLPFNLLKGAINIVLAMGLRIAVGGRWQGSKPDA